MSAETKGQRPHRDALIERGSGDEAGTRFSAPNVKPRMRGPPRRGREAGGACPAPPFPSRGSCPQREAGLRPLLTRAKWRPGRWAELTRRVGEERWARRREGQRAVVGVGGQEAYLAGKSQLVLLGE